MDPLNTQPSPGSKDNDGLKTPSALEAYKNLFSQRTQKYLDDSVPYLKTRWIITLLLSIIYIVRVYYLAGWYIVTYALGIYLLNLLIGFLTPKVEPDLSEDPGLPTKSDDEFRPFIRRLPEFKFWYASTRALVFAFLATFFEFFNLPVYAPVLVVYFCVLFVVTMKQQIKHMIKHKYVPFTTGKKKYGGAE